MESKNKNKKTLFLEEKMLKKLTVKDFEVLFDKTDRIFLNYDLINKYGFYERSITLAYNLPSGMERTEVIFTLFTCKCENERGTRYNDKNFEYWAFMIAIYGDEYYKCLEQYIEEKYAENQNYKTKLKYAKYNSCCYVDKIKAQKKLQNGRNKG